MREVNVSSVRTYRQIRAPPPTNGRGNRRCSRPGDSRRPSEGRPDEQRARVVSSRKEMTKPTPKAKKPGGRKRSSSATTGAAPTDTGRPGQGLPAHLGP